MIHNAILNDYLYQLPLDLNIVIKAIQVFSRGEL